MKPLINVKLLLEANPKLKGKNRRYVQFWLCKLSDERRIDQMKGNTKINFTSDFQLKLNKGLFWYSENTHLLQTLKS